VANGRAAITSRRFPPPWSAEETEACFIVRDANGQALAYVYYEQEPGRRAAASALPPPRRFRACKLIAAVRRSPIVINRSLGRIFADKLLRHPVGAPFGSGRR